MYIRVYLKIDKKLMDFQTQHLELHVYNKVFLVLQCM